MSTFIQLTSSGGSKILVNLSRVVSFAESQSSGGGSVMRTTDGSGGNVRESMTQIWQIIQNAKG